MVLGFISTYGAGSNELGNPYLSHFPDIYYDVSVHPVFSPCLLGRYFSACNSIYNYNRISQSCLALGKYWVTQSGYFRLANTVALGMSITDGKLLFCHRISQGSAENKIPMIDYNNRTDYELLNNLFLDDFGSPTLNLPPITIYDRPCPHKRALYTPDLLPAAFYVASENYVSTFTTPYYSPRLLILTLPVP